MTLKDWFTKLDGLKRIARPDLPIEDQQRDWGWNEALEKVKRLSTKYLTEVFKTNIMVNEVDCNCGEFANTPSIDQSDCKCWCHEEADKLLAKQHSK